jgi:hypothetical protein
MAGRVEDARDERANVRVVVDDEYRAAVDVSPFWWIPLLM